MGKKIIIFVILGFFISLIIKIEYFSVVLNLMAIATIMSLKHGRKKIKFDIELWLFQMTIIFYLFRESGLGLFTELENFYNNFNKVKIIFSIFFIIGMVYSAKIKGNILLKLYFFIYKEIKFIFFRYLLIYLIILKEASASFTLLLPNKYINVYDKISNLVGLIKY